MRKTNTKNYKCIKMLILFSILPFFAMAQTTTTITGVVIDDSGTPVTGVQIYIEETREGTISDLNGNYTLTSSGQGDVTFVIQSLGFITIKETITLNGETISRDAQLETDALSLDQIVVTGNANPKSKLESSIAVSSVDIVQIQNSGARGTSELYKTIPGLFVNASGGEGNGNMEVRGNPTGMSTLFGTE